MANLSVFDMLRGQPQARDFLLKAAEKPQGGYIFFGPDGVGKRTAALCFAAAVNPPSFSESILSLGHPDVIPVFPFKAEPQTGRDAWIQEFGKERELYAFGSITPDPNPSWVISISRIRELRKEMMYPPRVLPYRVALLFDFDRIRDEGANAFLKTLEEPQSRSILVLTTSRPFALPATIRSRTKLVRFNALEEDLIRAKLLEEGYPEDKVDIAVDVSFGSLKQAYRFLADSSSVILEEVFEYFKDASQSRLRTVDLIDQWSYRVELDRVISSFGLIFRWLVRARSGKLPRWPRLASLVGPLARRVSRSSLVSNILLTEKMGSRIPLNPTPSLFLYQYLASLSFD